MSNLRLMAILVIFLISLLAPSAQAANDLPPTSLLFAAQQEDDNLYTTHLGENRGNVAEGGSEIWTYEGKAGDVEASAQDDEPATQCAKGLQLFFAGRPDEALPLLEAGFAGRSEAAFVNSDDEARCALALAILRDRAGNHSQALAPYQVAQEIFKTNGNDELESMCLNSMGLIYHNQGRYALALSSYQRGLLIKQKIADRAGEGDALNGIGLVYANQARYAEALEQFTLALEIRREIEDRSGEGETINHIAAVYDQQGMYDEALDYYHQALSIRHALLDRVGEGITLNGIGLVYAHQGKYALALEQFTQALELRREVGNRAGEGRTLNDMAGVYRAQGKYHEALKQYKQALTISREVQDRATEGRILNDMGLVYHDLGKYSLALEQFTQALELMRQVGDRDDEGRTVNNIGLVYQAQGRYALALEQFIQALHIMRELSDRAGEGSILNNIGSVYRAQGKHEQALVEYQKALDIRREVEDRANEGSSLNNIALTYRGLGKYEEALESYQKALEIRREVGDRAGEGTTINNIGGLYRAQGEYDKALEQFKSALEIFREIGYRTGESAAANNIGLVYHNQEKYDQALTEFSVALQLRREIGNRAALGATLTNMGLAYEEQGQVEEALEHYEQAIELFEGLRTTAGSEEGRASFIAQHASLYDRAISIYHQQGRGTVAYQTSEQGRARSFLDSLSTGYVQLWDYEAADLWTDEREAYNARQVAQEALIRARAQEQPDAQLVADLEAILSEAEEEHTAAMTAISARGDQLAALVPGRSHMPTLSEVQALLSESPRQRGATTLISYWVLRDDDTLAFILTPDELKVVPLAVGLQELTEQIEAFSFSFVNPDLNSVDAHQSDELRQLYDWLIRPLKPHLNTPEVTIIPHGILHYLPFAALTDGERYFSDDYVLSTLPSASVLPAIQENRKPDALIESVLALGNPTYDKQLPALEGLILSDLPFAKQEVESLAALFGSQVEAHFGTDATESTLRQASQANILHIAAHGIYNPKQPLDSKLILASDVTNDGLFTVGEVYGLELTDSTLVVLSACETGLRSLNREGGQSLVTDGDEIVALNRAFLFAGTPTVISTLWSVNDASTGFLMERFYTHLQAGYGKAEALRQAQIDTQAEYPHPYYWAGFVLSGDAGEITHFAPEATVTPSNEDTPSPVTPNEATPTPIATAPTEEEPDSNGNNPCLTGILPLAVIALAGLGRQRKRRKVKSR